MKLNRKQQRFYKDNSLLSQRRATNYVYVYPGCGYELQKVMVNSTKLTIDELAYICVKSGKGCFYSVKDVDENEFFSDERYAYCDLSSYGLDNVFLLLENMRTENVEIYS